MTDGFGDHSATVTPEVYILAGAAGIEPTHTESKSAVLPLDYAPRSVHCLYLIPQTALLTNLVNAPITKGKEGELSRASYL